MADVKTTHDQPEKAPHVDDEVHSGPAPEIPTPVKVSFFRSTLWNTLVVGWASFLAPGIYNALASTGAGGLADVSGAHPTKREQCAYDLIDQYR
jgi:hypothetical protein